VPGGEVLEYAEPAGPEVSIGVGGVLLPDAGRVLAVAVGRRGQDREVCVAEGLTVAVAGRGVVLREYYTSARASIEEE